MNEKNEDIVNALTELRSTSEILVVALKGNDIDKAHEAVSILLMQGIGFFGPKSVVMQQFFPVFDTIKTRIDTNNLAGALGQTELFQVQLKAILAMIPK